MVELIQAMTYYLVQPWDSGAKMFEHATVVGEFETLEAAYSELERYAARLRERDLPPDRVAVYVVDEDRKPVLRG